MDLMRVAHILGQYKLRVIFGLMLALFALFVYDETVDRDNRLTTEIHNDISRTMSSRFNTNKLYNEITFYCAADYPCSGFIFHNKMEQYCRVVAEDAKNRLIFYQGFSYQSTGRDTDVDVFYLVVVVFSFFASISSHDAISREREMGTLPLVFSNPTSRIHFFLVQLLSRLAISLLPVLFVFAIIFFRSIRWEGHLDRCVSLFPIFFACLLYVAVFSVTSIIFSVLSRDRISSLVMAMLFWILTVLVYPNVSASIARSAFIHEKYDYSAEAFFQESSRAIKEHRLFGIIDALSPLGHLERIVECSSQKGLTDLQILIAKADQLRSRFHEWRNKQQSAIEAAHPDLYRSTWLKAEQVNEKNALRPDFQGMPVMEFQPSSLQAILWRSAVHFLSLIAAVAVSLLTGIVLFIKMDLRHAL